MSERYGDISSLVRPQGCIAAAEATVAGEIMVRDIYTYQYSILVQCGARGFCSVSRLLPYPAGMENPLETDHIASAARLCMAMCVDCPNRTTNK